VDDLAHRHYLTISALEHKGNLNVSGISPR
jgi:hypothetical protein